MPSMRVERTRPPSGASCLKSAAALSALTACLLLTVLLLWLIGPRLFAGLLGVLGVLSPALCALSSLPS